MKYGNVSTLPTALQRPQSNYCSQRTCLCRQLCWSGPLSRLQSFSFRLNLFDDSSRGGSWKCLTLEYALKSRLPGNGSFGGIGRWMKGGGGFSWRRCRWICSSSISVCQWRTKRTRTSALLFFIWLISNGGIYSWFRATYTDDDGRLGTLPTVL